MARAALATLLLLAATLVPIPTSAPAASAEPLPSGKAAAAVSPLTSLPLVTHPSSLVPTALLPLTAMRDDLATRLGVGLDRITVVAFDEVTWPDACLGVYEPGTVCAQLLTPGFLATFAATGFLGLFPYHGAGAYFIPAPFIQNATLTLPFEIR